MGFDPISMGIMAVGVAGAGVQAAGAYEQGQAQSQAAAYQAQVARNNSLIANQNAAWTEESGVAKETAQGMKTRAAVGSIKAGQAASGIDVNTGSAADVRSSASALGMLDAMTIRSNTAREAYGFEVAATSDQAQAGLLDMESKQAQEAGDISALGTFLSGASSVGSRWGKYSFGAPSG
jgi:hypothetical protein